MSFSIPKFLIIYSLFIFKACASTLELEESSIFLTLKIFTLFGDVEKDSLLLGVFISDFLIARSGDLSRVIDSCG